jgi:hypothetical protein
MSIAQVRGVLPMVIFLLFFLVPAFGQAFFGFVSLIVSALGVPFDLVIAGYNGFLFWRR